MKPFRFFIMCLVLCCNVAVWAQTGPDPSFTETDLIMPGITLRPDTTVDIGAKIFDSTSSTCRPTLGNTVLAIHGWWHTASTWRPMAKAMLEKFDKKVWDGVLITGDICRVVALDLPGHGRSGFPSGKVLFGDLLMDDYVTAILGSLDRLRQVEIRPSIVIGHSVGGLLVQRMQQVLISKGTNMYRAYSIRKAILLASAPPGGIPSLFFDSPGAAGLIAQFVFTDPIFGSYVYLPDPAWIGFLFSGVDGSISPKTPTPDEIRKLGYKAPEPLNGTLQLGSAPPFQRPAVSRGVFYPGNRTLLELVAYENDFALMPSEAKFLYEYLTYGGAPNRLAIVKGSDAVHDLHVADPVRLLSAIVGVIDIAHSALENIDPEP